MRRDRKENPSRIQGTPSLLTKGWGGWHSWPNLPNARPQARTAPGWCVGRRVPSILFHPTPVLALQTPRSADPRGHHSSHKSGSVRVLTGPLSLTAGSSTSKPSLSSSGRKVGKELVKRVRQKKKRKEPVSGDESAGEHGAAVELEDDSEDGAVQGARSGRGHLGASTDRRRPCCRFASRNTLSSRIRVRLVAFFSIIAAMAVVTYVLNEGNNDRAKYFAAEINGAGKRRSYTTMVRAGGAGWCAWGNIMRPTPPPQPPAVDHGNARADAERL